MDKYDTTEIYQDRIELAKLIRTICHLQDDDKQYVMAAVETNKQVYMFYQAPYQSNADYLEKFKAHLKLSKSHNGSVGYHPELAEVSVQEKYNITSDTANEYQKIEANINSRERYLTCMFLSVAENLRYKQIKTELKNTHNGQGWVPSRPPGIHKTDK